MKKFIFLLFLLTATSVVGLSAAYATDAEDAAWRAAWAQSTPPANQIWYNTTDNQPLAGIDFGSNALLSNSYDATRKVFVMTFASDITTAPESAFANQTTLLVIFLPEGITEIPANMFKGCTYLAALTVPASVTAIGEDAFKSTQLCSIEFAGTTPPTFPEGYGSIDPGMFFNVPEAALADYKSASGWENILKYTFVDQPGLNQLWYTTTDSLQLAISPTDFTYTAAWDLTSVGNKVSELNSYYGGHCSHFFDGKRWRISLDESCYLQYAQKLQGPSRLKTIYLPFYAYVLLKDNTALEYARLPQMWGNKKTALPTYEFMGCTSLKTVILPESMIGISDFAFYNCTSLESITLQNPCQVVVLGKNVFVNAPSTVSLHVPITQLEAYQASSAWSAYATQTQALPVSDNTIIYKSAKKLYLTDLFIQWHTFTNGVGVVEYSMSKSFVSSAAYAGKNCTALYLPDVTWQVDDNAFENCTLLTEFHAKGLQRLYDSMFAGCTSLTDVDCPNILAINSNAFSGCTSLSEYTVPASVMQIQSQAFSGCSSLASVTFTSATPPTLGADVFSGCSSSLVIHVPAENVCAYKYAWPALADKIEGSCTSDYTVTFSVGEGGSISVKDADNQPVTLTEGATTVGYQGTLHVTITPDTYYRVASCTYNGEDYSNLILQGVLHLTDITEDVALEITFEEALYIVSDNPASDSQTLSTLGPLMQQVQKNPSALQKIRIDRTLYCDGSYNTLCLPFSLSAEQLAASPLAGYTKLRRLASAEVESAGQEDEVLTLTLEDATSIEAGVPYLIAWPAGTDIVNPTFTGVQVTNIYPQYNYITVGAVECRGIYTPYSIPANDPRYLFVGAENTLYWASSSAKLKGFRAYFYLKSSSSAPGRSMRARIVEQANVATTLEDADRAQRSEKVLIDGRICIVTDGRIYDVLGRNITK